MRRERSRLEASTNVARSAAGRPAVISSPAPATATATAEAAATPTSTATAAATATGRVIVAIMAPVSLVAVAALRVIDAGLLRRRREYHSWG